MKETVSEIPAKTGGEVERVQNLFRQYVVPTYGRFDLALERGSGSEVWDVAGKRYLDFGGGIAVNVLGHAHPELAATLAIQATKLTHISNLYYHEPQGRLAEALVGLISPGKVFFCNSGGEANEALFKLARKFGHDEGRFEILTAHNSFHGRTLAGIAATGQDKVKKGFEPMVQGFRHVPFNDLEAVENALSPATVAVLIEGVQGEGGVTPATPEYLTGLRQLCNDRKLLLLMDEVQCGHYRTGRFHSYQRILERQSLGSDFLPDAVSMAKALAGGFPMGAMWVRQPYADLLGPGSHATTFGGTPLACTLALKVLEIIQRDHLDTNARKQSDYLKAELTRLAQRFPSVVKKVRGLGLMLGMELAPGIPLLSGSHRSPALQMTDRLQQAGLLVVPAGQQVIRLLPALNIQTSDAEEAVRIIESVVSTLAAQAAGGK